MCVLSKALPNVTQRRTGVGPFDCCPPLALPGKPFAPGAYSFNIILGSVPPVAKAARVILPPPFPAQARKKFERSPDFPRLFLRGRRIKDFHRPMPVKNTSQQDLATCIYKCIYSHMKTQQPPLPNSVCFSCNVTLFRFFTLNIIPH
jgi:hypothetical protein